MARPRAWLGRRWKTPTGWRVLECVWKERYGKPLLTTRAIYDGAEVETPGGEFVVEWKEDGKRKRERLADDPLRATKALQRQLLRLQAQDAGLIVESPNDPRKRRLKDAIADFLAEKKRGKAKKTHGAYKQVLETFAACCGRAYLEDIKRVDIMDRFIGTLQDQGLADRTQYHRFMCLLSFLKHHKIALVTAKDAPKFVASEIRVYTANDLTALFAACKPEERLLFRFFLGSGLREQEVQHAEASDLLNDCQTMWVREKPEWGFKPKGRKERKVPLPDSLAEELREHVKTLSGTLLFPHPKNKRPDGHLLRRLQAVAKRANLTATYGKWTLHIFRHTFCTMHLQAGTDLRTLQKWAGHENLETTQGYLDWLDAHSEEARDATNNAFATTFAPPTLALAPALVSRE
jgi:integrase/recombinase XerD